MKHILFIVGSQRKQSFNMQVAKLAEEYLKESSLADVEYLDYSKLPFINQDYEFPTPVEVQAVRDKVATADGLWFFTPEYNYSYPGSLKNLIDWLSRSLKQNDFASGTAIKGKRCAISGIGGKNKTAGAREKLEELLRFVKADVLTQSEGFAVNPTAFSTNIVELSKEDKERLCNEADSFIGLLS